MYTSVFVFYHSDTILKNDDTICMLCAHDPFCCRGDISSQAVVMFHFKMIDSDSIVWMYLYT